MTASPEVYESPPAGAARLLGVAYIEESKTNPRRTMDAAALAELTESVRLHGVLQPILVRPKSLRGDGEVVEIFEVVAGHRRLAAARAAGLEYVPAMVRELRDVEVLEIQLIENLHRSDIHPLEEAEALRQLTAAGKYDVARLAARIGRSLAYVYDRLKLVALTKDAKKAFLEDRITAGHAILLARLKPADQERAMNVDKGGVFTKENLLFDPEARREGPYEGLKTKSVAELKAWIDEHVRFDVEVLDEMLFPETAEKLDDARKVVPITYSHYIAPEARDGRTYFPRAWKRADGKKDSTTCEHAVMGYVAVGLHSGEAFEVCIAREKCEVHWAEEMREKQKRAKVRDGAAKGSPEKSGAKPVDRAREAALNRAREEASEAILAAVVEAGGKVSLERAIRLVLACEAYAAGGYLRWSKQAGKLVSEKDARAWIDKAPVPELQRALAWWAFDTQGDSFAKALGIDVAAIEKRLEAKALELLEGAKAPSTPAAKKATKAKAKSGPGAKPKKAKKPAR